MVGQPADRLPRRALAVGFVESFGVAAPWRTAEPAARSLLVPCLVVAAAIHEVAAEFDHRTEDLLAYFRRSLFKSI